MEGSATEPRGDAVRGAVVNGSVIVWLVTGHSLRGTLPVDQGAARVSRGGSLGRGGLHGRNALGAIGDETCIDGRSNPASAKGGGTPNSEKRHDVFLDVGKDRCQRGST